MPTTTVNPGGTLNFEGVARISVTNLSAYNTGHFSVQGASYSIDAAATQNVNLLEDSDSLTNSGKTDLSITY